MATPLKAIVDDITTVAKELRDFYVQKVIKVDGAEKTVWALHIHGAQELPEVRALASNYSRVRGELTQLSKQTTALVAGDGLRQALRGAGCREGFIPAAVALLEPQIKVSNDNRGNLVATGPASISLSELAKTFMGGEGAVFLADTDPAANSAEGKRERGTAQASGSLRVENNPWSRAHWSLSQQGQCLRTDRARADAMAQAAGHARAVGAKRANAR
jgi:hypothetical protein